MRTLKFLTASFLIATLAACQPADETAEPAVQQTAEPQPAGPTVEEAVAFVAAAEERLAELGQHSERVAWVLSNFITFDTELLAAKAAGEFTAAQVEIAAQAAQFNGLEGLDYDTARVAAS